VSLKLYDPKPQKNNYLSRFYFEGLKGLCNEKRIPFEEIANLDVVANSTVLVNGDYLEPEVIVRLKENQNKIISFDINDGTSFTYSYVQADEVELIDVIFKVAGVQTEKESYETIIDDDLNYTRSKVPFRGGNFGKYFDMVEMGKVKSLPYPPWDYFDVPNIPWEQRNKLALVRGGHHYIRVHLYFNLLAKGMVDDNSMFAGTGYIHQYCDDCKRAFKEQGGVTYDYIEKNPNMPCRLKFWEHNFMLNCGRWNNSCVTRYLDTAKLLAKKNGMDLNMVEKALNSSFVGGYRMSILNKYLFYADHKWIHSIYAPPRFWEAAEARIINYVAERVNDQEYFPCMEDNVHYLTYKEDFSNIDWVRDVTKEQFEYISNNCYELYKHWIKPDKFATSTNLLQHILDTIE